MLDTLAAAHDFDVPPGMVEAEFNQIWAQLEHEAGHEADPEAALRWAFYAGRDINPPPDFEEIRKKALEESHNDAIQC